MIFYSPPTTLIGITQNQITTYTQAWATYGSDRQIDILIEEMSELTQALIKARRNGKIFSTGIIHETADILICLQQIELQMRTNILLPKPDDTVHYGNLWNQVEEIYKHQYARFAKKVINDYFTW